MQSILDRLTQAYSLFNRSPSQASELDEIAAAYNLVDRSRVFEFVLGTPNLKMLLKDAPKAIANYFPDAELILAVTDDPEVPDWENLVIRIATKLDPDEAFDKLTALDQNWWLESSMNNPAGNRLFITLDF